MTKPTTIKQNLMDQTVTAAIETTINTLIKDNPQHLRQINRLKGKALQLHFIEYEKTLTFLFSQQTDKPSQNIDVLAHYEAEPDCYLELHITALPELRNPNNITPLIEQGKIKLQGDIQLAQQFWQLMSDSKPDLEEWLSKATGDVIAHTLMQGAKDTSQWLKKRLEKHHSHLAEVLTEEWKIMPEALEIAFFCEQVSELSAQADTFEKRLMKIQEQS